MLFARGQIYIAIKAKTSPYPEIVRQEDEKYFYNPASLSREPFPSINETPRLSLSVIIPAYNEERRCKCNTECIVSKNCCAAHNLWLQPIEPVLKLPPFAVPKMLDECLAYLEKRSERDATFKYEVIVVSNGSRDSTAYIGHRYSKRFSADKVRVLALRWNRGKGGGIRLVSTAFPHLPGFSSSPIDIRGSLARHLFHRA